MRYLICKKCGGYYELQEGESEGDFDSCQCGGQLLFSNTINLPETESHEPQNEEKTRQIKICPNCGNEISQYSIICRVCGEKIEVDMEKEPHQQDFIDNGGNTQITSPKEEIVITQPNTYPTNPELMETTQNQLSGDETSKPGVDKEVDKEPEKKKPLEKTVDEKKTIFCPFCGRENDSNVDRCKYCQKEIDVEKLRLKSSELQEPLEKETEETYNCPYCGVEISKHSIICRSCGKSLDSPETLSRSKSSNIICSKCGRKETDPAAEYCKSCGTPLKSSSDIKSEDYPEDYLAMFSSKSFLIYLGISLLVSSIIGFVVSPPNMALIFIILGMGFSFSYRHNAVSSMLGGLLLGISGYLFELMFHMFWNAAFNLNEQLTLLFIFAAFGLIGGLIGNQLLERGIVV